MTKLDKPGKSGRAILVSLVLLMNLHGGEKRPDFYFSRERQSFLIPLAPGQSAASAPLQTEQIIQAWVNDAWENAERVLTTYDAQFRVANEQTQSWNGSDWATESTTSYVYDNNGNVIQENQFLFFSGTFHPEARNDFTWDTQGNLIEKIESVAGGPGQWNPFQRTVNVPGSFFTASETLEYWTGADWAPFERTTGSWNAGPQTLVFVTEQLSGAVWEPKERVTYSYSRPTNLLDLLTTEIYVDSNWQNERRLRYTIDPITLKATQIYEDLWNGSAWEDTWNILFTYDNDTNLAEAVILTNDAGSWVNLERWMYTYLDDTQITSVPSPHHFSPGPRVKTNASGVQIQVANREDEPLQIWNTRGKLIETLRPGSRSNGYVSYQWDFGTTRFQGIYFLGLKSKNQFLKIVLP